MQPPPDPKPEAPPSDPQPAPPAKAPATPAPSGTPEASEAPEAPEAPKAPPAPKKPDEFALAIEKWRKQRGLREDEPLLLCLELFRIHQDQWDTIRRQELPSFSELRTALAQLDRQTQMVVRHVNVFLEELRRQPKPEEPALVTPTHTGLFLTALLAALTGMLVGKLLL